MNRTLDELAERNPIILAGIRARLRFREFLPWAVLLLIFAGFFFLLPYLSLVGRGGADVRLAARAGLAPLFILQSMILVLLGTGRIASAVAELKEKGILDDHRMTLMSPSEKIFGLLLGLPAREYALFLLTLPLVAFSVIVGGIPLLKLGELYLVLFSTVLLYHSIAMTAGMTARHARNAAIFSQSLVLLFHFVLPAVSGLGFQFLEYLSIRPTFLIIAADLAPAALPAIFVDRAADLRSVPFLVGTLPASLFSLMIQAGVIVTLMSLLHRKWREPRYHALSKPWALGAFIGFQLLMLGWVVPFLTVEAYLARLGNAAMTKLGFSFFLLNAAIAVFLLFIITPSGFEVQRGRRLAARNGWQRMPADRDEASSGPWAAAIAAAGFLAYLALIWVAYYNDRLHSPDVGMISLLIPGIWWVALVMGVQQLLAWGEAKGLYLVAVFGWLCPVLIAVVVSAAEFASMKTAAFLTTPSALTAPFWMIFNLTDPGRLGIMTHHDLPQYRMPLAVLTAVWTIIIWSTAATLNHRRQAELTATINQEQSPKSPAKPQPEPAQAFPPRIPPV